MEREGIDEYLEILCERADVQNAQWPTSCWKTRDGRQWRPQDVLIGWGGTHATDRWACTLLATAIGIGAVTTHSVQLPQPLQTHSAEDPAWRFIVELADPAFIESEPGAFLGKADLLLRFPGRSVDTCVEFGTCRPAKFVLNLGAPLLLPREWMIVPYDCAYAFAFQLHMEHFATTLLFGSKFDDELVRHTAKLG